MGLLNRLFGSKIAYPPLPEGDEAVSQLDDLKTPLEALAYKASERLEVVPADHEAFVFLGKPPHNFDIAWIHGGKVTSLNDFAEEHSLTHFELGRLVARLSEAYEHASETPRYSTEFGGKRMVVIPSKGLEKEMHQIMTSTLH